MQLSDLGFDPWFEQHAAEYRQEGCSFARVSAVDRGSYLLHNEAGEVPAELTGRLSYSIDSPMELPCVGDWVTASYYNDNTAAIIHRVFPRKSFLRRKSAGDTVDYQMIAANIDTAFIVQSCHFDFNPNRLDRYLAMAADGQVEPVILLTKTDLIPPDELQQKLDILHAASKAKVLPLSNVTGDGINELQQLLTPGQTFCLLGSSGVGKTTLLNRLLGRDAFDTRAVSASGEGTHTTSRRQLIVLEQGALLIDTPGMREVGMVGSEGVEGSFAAFAALAEQCQYADCSHRHEPGCAIRAAVERGELGEERYASYLKLKKESEFYQLSYLDKRKKDKAFGKFIKNAKKQLQER